MRVLGVIPARGGSKGVTRKNIRKVAGLPLIAYTIRAALGSERLTSVVVSTDDAEIRDTAERFGCPVIVRTAELAGDETPMVPVIAHAIRIYEAQGERYDAVAVLQPTTPLRVARDIDLAIQLLEESSAECVVSVYRVEDVHPARMYTLQEGRLVPFTEEPADSLRQSLPDVYHRNGAIYLCRCPVLLRRHQLVTCYSVPYIMPPERSLNIDTLLDLRIAEMLLSEERRDG